MRTSHYQSTVRSFIDEIDHDLIVIDPDWQRGVVWTLEQKQCLIDSILKGMPFGSLMVWVHDGEKTMVDGKQRTTTLAGFVKGEFTVDRQTFQEMAQREQQTVLNTYVHVLMIEEATEHDIVDIFDRINSGKQLSDGERIASQKEVSNVVSLVYDTLLDPNGRLSKEWEQVFGKIKEQKRKNEFTNTVPLFMSSLFGLSAYTTSYPLLKRNGLNNTVGNEQYERFLRQVLTYLSIVKGLRENLDDNTLFKGTSGIVPLGKVSPLWCSILLLPSRDTSILGNVGSMDQLKDMWTQVFRNLANDTELQKMWDTRLRKNRTEASILSDIRFAVSQTTYAN